MSALETQIEKFLEAIRAQRTSVARQILAATPAIARASLDVAAAAGDAAAVRDWLHGNNRAGDVERPELMARALGYACGSKFHSLGTRAASESREVVALLLDRGADPNQPLAWPAEGHDVKLPVLYFATESENIGVIRLLLARGAKPDDGESTYHSAQHNRTHVLELLVEHGADLSSAQQPFGNTPLYFLAGHLDDEGGDAAWAKGFAWLLEHGANPNVGSCTADEVPLHKTAAAPRLLAVTRLLLAHGADPNRGRADGRTPYATAVRSGNVEAIALLTAHGADVTRVSPIDRLLGACFRGSLDEARALASTIPNWPQLVADVDRGAIVRAVWQDQLPAVTALAALGFDASAKGTDGHTPLHPAAWLGRSAIVNALLALGVDVNVRDDEHGSAPLGWAAHGSRFCRAADDDYLTIIKLLLAAGATREASINRSGELPSTLASPAVARFLREHDL